MHRFLAVSAVISALAWPTAPVAQDSVGVVAGMQTQVIRGTRQMTVGDRIFQNDTVRTNQTGISQFQFSDRSSAKLGPNSSIQFSSDIVALAGREATIAVRMISGIARFTGSDSTKSNPIIVRTPNMALGVLGGVVDVSAANRANLLSGRMVCAVTGEQKFVRNPGFSCIVGPDGRLQVVKTPTNFAAVLDSTAVPNAGQATGANVGLSTGRFNAPDIDLRCGSDTSAQDQRCAVDFGGYPLPEGRSPFGRTTEVGPGETNNDLKINDDVIFNDNF
ncbi:MAG: FecR family protein [Pseudomonadota bacterium]